jgi:hypothetical protein
MAKHGHHPSTSFVDGFPAIVATDSESVAWALRTACARWARNDHIEAIAWLRRAAQEACDEGVDERALYLANVAADFAELAERRPKSAVQSVAQQSFLRPPAPASLFEDQELPTRSRGGAALGGVAAAELANDVWLDPWAETAMPASAPPTSVRSDHPGHSDQPVDVGLFESDEVVTSAPPLAALESESRFAIASARTTMPDVDVDLDAIAEFADVPDEARQAFARAATTCLLSRGDELTAFAAALVITGVLEVAPTVNAVPVKRFAAGSVVLRRGTLLTAAPMRFVCASDRAVVALWSDSTVDDAFDDYPWVEDELRKAADRLHALVGAALGPFGAALSASHREELVSRMELRTFGPGEVIVDDGRAAPCAILIAAGEVAVSRNGQFERALRVGALACASASGPGEPRRFTLRAGVQGALALVADHVLLDLMTSRWPLLIETFSES